MRSVPLTLAVSATLACATTALAQNAPYQASQRQAYGSAIGQSDLPKGGRFEPRIEAAAQRCDGEHRPAQLAQDGSVGRSWARWPGCGVRGSISCHYVVGVIIRMNCIAARI